MSLKKQAISGFFWGTINNLSVQIVQFIVGLILARLLSPADFGLVGMLTVFISISSSFTDGGFTSALIRKERCSSRDYSTVFIFNLAVSLLIYIILFYSSASISIFFEKPILALMLKILALKLVIDAFSVTQVAMLTRNLNFKFQAKISLAAALSSGIVGVGFALYGFGPWSLIAQALTFAIVNSVLLYIFNSWKPSLEFDRNSFKEMFGFGSKLLGSSLLGKFFNETSTFLIGKYLSFTDLGFYTRANTFKNLPAQTINTILTKVTYPLLAKFNHDHEKLKTYYIKIIKVTTFISFLLMGLMAATADNFIIILIGEKWRQSIFLFQLLSIVGMLYPLQALNLNILNVVGRSDVHLKLTFIKNIISLPILIFSLWLGLKGVVAGLVLVAIIHYIINSMASGKFINYTMIEQIKDIFTQSLVIIIICLIIYCLNFLFLNIFITLTLQVLIFIFLIILSGEIFKLYSYIEIKKITFDLLKNIKK